jgi:UDP-N-acetylglucosamine transferase subunit ALG13
MILLTVGTQFPFDRLVKAVDNALDEGLIKDEIFAQIGESSYRPRNFESVKSVDRCIFDEWVQRSSGIISHAGIGTIALALRNGKPLVAMPRLRRYREVVNDHQLAIARNFAHRGYILVAYEVDDLQREIQHLKSFSPPRREADTKAVTSRVHQFLESLKKSKFLRGCGSLANSRNDQTPQY